MYRIIFAILFLIQQTISCASNLNTDSIRGKVVDTDGDPVMFATVRIDLIPVQDSKLSTKYFDTNTDLEGEFTLPLILSCDSIYISVRSMGYKPFFKKYPANNVTSEAINITMITNEVELSEVIVKGNYHGVSESGDTLRFSPNYFINGSEHTISDVIKKMPGFEVDNNGNVSYQGKNLDKVLVNGKDIFSTSGEYINNLPADFVSQIEVIDNFNMNDAANGFRSNPLTALNLKTKSHSKWNGRIEGGSGIRSKYYTNNSTIGLFSNHSFSAILNANNDGKPLFSIIDYLTSRNLSESLSSNGITSINLSSEEQRLLLPPDNEYKRAGLLGCVNYSYNKNNQYNLKINTIYSQAKINAESSIIQEFSNGVSSLSSDGRNNNNLYLSSTVTNQWNYSTKGTFHSHTIFSFGDYHNSNNTENIISDYRYSDINGLYDSKPIRFTQSLSIDQMIGNGILYSLFELRLEDTNNTKLVSTSNNLDVNTPNISSISEPKKNEMSLSKQSLQCNLGYIMPIFENKINFKFEAQYERTRDFLHSIFCQNNKKEKLLFNNLYGYTGLFKNKDKLRFDIGVKLVYRNINPFGLNDMDESNFLTISPIANFELMFEKNNRLTFSFRYYETPLDLIYLTRAKSILGNSSYSTGSSISNYLKKNLDLKISYRYMSLFNRLTLFCFATYIKSWDDVLINITNENINSYYFYQDNGKKDIIMGQMYFSKGIADFPLTFKLVPKFNITNTKAGNTLGITNIKNEIYSVQTSIQTNFRNLFFNFEVEGNYSYDLQKIGMPYLQKHRNFWRTNLKTVITPIKSMNFTLMGKWEATTIGTENKSLFDLDFNFSYKFNKILLGVKGENVFHLNKIEWLSESITSDMYSMTKYRKIPGYMMAYVKFSF